MTDGQDPMMARIEEAAELGRQTDRGAARRRFDELWASVGPDGDPLHRCALAHYAADVQDDLHEELRWDSRALAAADELTDDRARAHHASLAVAGFYPSLHLNLADVHRRLGDLDRASRHVERARAAVGALDDDGYGRMIRAGIDRCGALIAEQEGGGATG